MTPGPAAAATPDLRLILRSRGLRATGHRKRVLQGLLDAPGPLRASALLARVSGLDRATLYRTLNRLVDTDLVRVVTSPRGVRRFVVVRGPPTATRTSAHFDCTACGRQMSVPDPAFELALRSSRWSAAIQQAQVQVTLSGACPDCLAAEGAA